PYGRGVGQIAPSCRGRGRAPAQGAQGRWLRQCTRRRPVRGGLGPDRFRRCHRSRLPARGSRVLQHRKDVAGSRPGGRYGSLSRYAAWQGAGMRIAVHAVGRMKAGPERELAERYFDRFAKSGPGIGLEFAGVTETPESRARSADERRREEARKLGSLADGAALILLDERGKNFTSTQFAARIAAFRDGGRRNAVLAIGGPDGHDEELR